MYALLLLFLLNLFCVRTGETSPPAVQYNTFLFSRTETSPSQQRLTSTLSFHVPAYPRCSEKHEKRRTVQTVKKKKNQRHPCYCFTITKTTHSLTFFFSVFFSCCGSMPLISHHSWSPPWPFSVILENVIIIVFLQQRCKILFDCRCAKMITVNLPIFFFFFFSKTLFI